MRFLTCSVTTSNLINVVNLIKSFPSWYISPFFHNSLDNNLLKNMTFPGQNQIIFIKNCVYGTL